MNDIAISLKNVSKYYKLYNNPKDRLKEALHRKGKSYHKKFYATKNLNLEIKKGEILGIVGKNGSGKSTLLKLITGVLKPDEGTVEVNGKISALLELGSGFNPEFTGMQNIFFYGTILGFSKEEMKEKVDEILAFADIGDFIYQPLKTYSSGMKSRLGFAVAVHIDPEILILDEVLAVGDVLFRRKCYAKMEEFFKGGKTILYVSHDANSINQLCTKAIFLDQGNVLLESDANTVTKYYQKYLFSKSNETENIRQEILNLDTKNTSFETTNNKQENPSVFNKSRLTTYYIPDFIPQNTIEYKRYNVDIHSPKMTTKDGTIVNVLVYGETYVYEVTFTSHENMEFNDIAFGIDIHTLKGSKMSSIEANRLFRYGYSLPSLSPFEEINVQFEFTCLLAQGDYFINNGLSSYNNHQQEVINRKVDLFCFKVLDFEKRITDGQIYLFNKLKIKNQTIWEYKSVAHTK